MTLDHAIWLFGSHARGRKDEFSDLDVLFVGSATQANAQAIVADLIENSSASVSVYSWQKIYEMQRYGSLFLLHIQMEGRCIYETPDAKGKLIGIIEKLPPYSRIDHDTNSFRQAINDIRWGISAGSPLDFEASSLSTVTRHAAILLCYLIGRPSFERYKPIEHVIEHLGLEKEYDQAYNRCYEFKLVQEHRKKKIEEPSTKDVERTIALADKIVETLANHNVQ